MALFMRNKHLEFAYVNKRKLILSTPLMAQLLYCTCTSEKSENGLLLEHMYNVH